MNTVPHNHSTLRWKKLLWTIALAVSPFAQAGEITTEAPLMVDSFTPSASMDTQAEPQEKGARQRAARALPTPTAITLEALSEDAVVRSKSARPDAPLQIGVGRAVAQTKDVQATDGMLQWEDLPGGGKAAAISFTSPQALGVRIGLQIEALPPGTTFRTYAQGGNSELEVPATEVLLAIQRNINADGDSAAARTYWFAPVEGSEATMEIELAPGMDVEAVRVSVPMLAHKFETREDAQARASGSCNIDVMCMPQYAADRTSIAHIEFQEGGSWYICSGTLLNNAANDKTPYFLTANHCIDTQTVASTMNSYWFYWATNCNGSTINPGQTKLTGGATLLWSETPSDTTLLRLNKTAPSGVTFQGWLAGETVAKNAPVTGLHHPSGDKQKVSQGTVTGYSNCQDKNDGFFECMINVAEPDSNRYTVRWTDGTTEGGSSGSSLLYQKGTSQYVVGVLNSGSASCINRTGSDHYGRFDQAYAHGNLAQWLAPQASGGGRAAVYRFYNATTGAHFFTIDEAERDYVIASLPTFHYEGVAFYANAAQQDGLNAVFRFFHQTLGTHFYTINAAERDAILANWPVYKLEGTAWFASQGEAAGASALYRFYLRSKGVHFYTISAAERDAIIANWPAYEYEGIGYYAWPSP